MNKIKLEFLSLPVNVRLARVVVAAFVADLDLPLNEVEELKVAVSEAVTNAIIHGYDQNPEGVITLNALLDNGVLEVFIEDKGKGMNPEQIVKSDKETNNERVGLGFTFMKSFMDSVEVSSKNGKGTLVKLVKSCDRQTLFNRTETEG